MANAVSAGRLVGDVAARDRLAGMAGLGFVTFVIVQNAGLLRGSPANDASIEEISRFYTGNETAVTLAVGLVAINIPLLLLFATRAYGAMRAAGADAMAWGRLGLVGAGLLAATFAVTTAVQITLLSNVETLTAQPALTQMIWDLHAAAFAMSMVALGTTLLGFSRAGLLAALSPSWLAYLGHAGVAALIIAGATSVAMVEGSPTIFIGLLGFLTWLLWLAFTSIRLLTRQAETS